jgi:hypothetical protein
MGAAAVELTEADLRDIETALAGIDVKGAGYPAHLQARGDCSRCDECPGPRRQRAAGAEYDPCVPRRAGRAAGG